MNVWKALLNLIFPPRCILCGQLLTNNEQIICAKCCNTVRNCPPFPDKIHPSGKRKLHFLDSYTGVWYYEENVRNSILRFKFFHARRYAAGYGHFLGEKLRKEHPEGFDLITWAPVSLRRKWKRGYDQAELLARAVGRELGIKPVRLLKKCRHNAAQSSMNAEARKANVIGVYSVTDKEILKGKRILILDDVFTTGATSEECARMLLTAGAKEVHCATVAAAQRSEK